MKKLTKYLAAVCALALFGALFAGCSGQASSASSASSAASTADLLAELQTSANDTNYKSVTLKMDGTINIDYAAMTSSGSSASASASSADTSSKTSIPMKVDAQCDMSGSEPRMHLVTDMLGQSFELYTTGNNAVIVMYGQTISATLDELGMSDYSSIENIVKSQTGDLSKMESAVKSIEKTTEGSDTVYKIVADPAKLDTGTTSQLNSLSQLGVSLNDITMTYRINDKKQLSKLTVEMTGTGLDANIAIDLTDYDATTVPEAPAATVTYSDLMKMTQQQSQGTQQSQQGAAA